MRISDWSSDVCSSDLLGPIIGPCVLRGVWLQRPEATAIGHKVCFAEILTPDDETAGIDESLVDGGEALVVELLHIHAHDLGAYARRDRPDLDHVFALSSVLSLICPPPNRVHLPAPTVRGPGSGKRAVTLLLPGIQFPELAKLRQIVVKVSLD